MAVNEQAALLLHYQQNCQLSTNSWTLLWLVLSNDVQSRAAKQVAYLLFAGVLVMSSYFASVHAFSVNLVRC